MDILPVFTDIADAIRHQIQTAKTDIVVNVPWFTDDSLFKELIAKAQAGVSVSIGIEDDNINQGVLFNHIDITRFGGSLYLNRSGNRVGLNHEKYCIIDQRIVLFGSYNWTYRASQYNRESILIIDDSSMAQQYWLRFLEMTQLPSVKRIGPLPHIVLTDSQKSPADPSFLLKAEIQLLEAEIAQLETEKSELENRIEYGVNQIQMALHELLVEKLTLEARLAIKRATETDKGVDRQKANQQWRRIDEAQTMFSKMSERQRLLDVPVDEASLKKLYREACMLGHPDKFMDQPEKQQKATKLMTQLTEAYRNKDLDSVQTIWQNLQDGTAFGFDWSAQTNSRTLLRIKESLLAQKETLVAIMNDLQQSFMYILITQHSDLNEYIAQQRRQLQIDIEVLKQSLS